MVGGMASLTTTLNVAQDAWLFALSVALQLTGVVPILKELPDAGIHDDAIMPELSTDKKFHVTIAVGVLPFVGVAVKGDEVVYGGHVSVGGVASTSAIANAQVETLLAILVAEQEINEVPIAEKLRGLEVLQLTLGVPSASVAVGIENEAEAATFIPFDGMTNDELGQVIMGLNASRTAKVRDPPAIVADDEEARTIMLNADVIVVGVVENVNV